MGEPTAKNSNSSSIIQLNELMWTALELLLLKSSLAPVDENMKALLAKDAYAEAWAMLE